MDATLKKIRAAIKATKPPFRVRVCMAGSGWTVNVSNEDYGEESQDKRAALNSVCEAAKRVYLRESGEHHWFFLRIFVPKRFEFISMPVETF